MRALLSYRGYRRIALLIILVAGLFDSPFVQGALPTLPSQEPQLIQQQECILATASITAERQSRIAAHMLLLRLVDDDTRADAFSRIRLQMVLAETSPLLFFYLVRCQLTSSDL